MKKKGRKVMATLKSKLIKAKKEHVCDCCNTLISKGEDYHYIVQITDGEFMTTKLHPSCNKAVNKIIDYWSLYGNDVYEYGYTFPEVISEIVLLLREKGINTSKMTDKELIEKYLKRYK